MDRLIFAVGLFVSLLAVGGLIFTVVEFRRLEQRPRTCDDRFPL